MASDMTGFNLTNYLPYLLNRAGNRIAASFSHTLRAYDITLQMWRVLAALNHEDGQRVTNLARLTTIDASTLSRVIDGMVRKSLIERRRADGDRTDGRAVTVHLTDGGRRLTDTIIPISKRY